MSFWFEKVKCPNNPSDKDKIEYYKRCVEYLDKENLILRTKLSKQEDHNSFLEAIIKESRENNFKIGKYLSEKEMLNDYENENMVAKYRDKETIAYLNWKFRGFIK